MSSPSLESSSRCGFVAVIGAPNAGKSTLVNALVGAKVSIVTHKVQTTRARIRGVALHEVSQIILVDTPGIFKPKRRLDQAMVDAAWSGEADADLVALIIDAPGYSEVLAQGEASKGATASAHDTDLIIEALKKRSRKVILVLNKIDLMKREDLLQLTQQLHAHDIFSHTFMISSEKGDGVSDLKAFLAGEMPLGPWHYPEDQVADLPMRLLAAEITREKLTLRLHQELPYASTVETEGWEEQKNGSVRIEQVIYVERDSQKAIVLGKGGRTIKDIGSASRKELEEMLERRVHLFLFAKVRERWADDPARYREMGLDFPR